jgi:apolipoprotein N-acyltransferase
MQSSWKLWVAAVLSAALLELPFPLAGPLPPWRSVFAWFGLVPLVWAVLSLPRYGQRRQLLHGFLIAYLCGVLWYAGNCYWIYDTMLIYGDLPPVVSALLLIGFSLVLGAYFGLFGLGILLVRRATGSVRLALVFAPFLWTGLELAAARITSVPWDQLGYSQVDNALINQLAPFTGVYGITFVLVLVNALLAGALLVGSETKGKLTGRWAWAGCGALLAISGFAGVYVAPPKPDPTATAVLIQPNLDVGAYNNWTGATWSNHIAQFAQLAGEQCKSYIAGVPQTGAPRGEVVCPPYPTHPDLVVWPESPAPFFEDDPQFEQAMAAIARKVQAPLIVNAVGADYSATSHDLKSYVSAVLFDYDKIHLVPFGEYIPFQDLLSFAHKLTGRVARWDRGTTRNVFLLDTQNGGSHRYGVFICYEAVFADEVRQFRASWSRGARQHQRRRLVRRHERSLATAEHGAHAGHRKPALVFARHQQRRDRGDRSLRPRAAEHSSPPGGRAAGRVRLSRRCHLLHRARRCVRVALCHTGIGRLWALGLSAVLPSQSSIQSQVIRAKHVVERSRIRLRSRARPSARPAGVSLTLLASAGNSPT